RSGALVARAAPAATRVAARMSLRGLTSSGRIERVRRDMIGVSCDEGRDRGRRRSFTIAAPICRRNPNAAIAQTTLAETDRSRAPYEGVRRRGRASRPDSSLYVLEGGRCDDALGSAT